jgi:O-antigen ligase
MIAPSLPQSRASSWEWAQTALVAVNLAWTTLSLGGYRAETMVVTVAMNALLLAVHFGRRAVVGAERPWHPAGWLLVPFLLYATANVLWVSPVRWLAWQDWLGWVQLIAVFWVVVNDVRARTTRKALCGVMVLLAVIGTALACYQRFALPDWLMLGATQAEQFLSRSSGPFAVPNSFAAMLVLLIPPTAAPMWVRSSNAVTRVVSGYLTAVLLLGLGLTLSRGAWLGLAAAVVLWPLFAGRSGWRRRMVISVAALVVILVSIVAVYRFVPTARERLDHLMSDGGERSRPVMWRAAWNIFRAQPVFGGGAGSYNVLFEQHRPEHEQKEPQWAHNDYLNTLSDYGAVGGALFFGPCALMLAMGMRRRSAQRSHDSTPPGFSVQPMSRDWFDSSRLTVALTVGLLAFALHLVVDFHLKIPALAMLVATVAGLAVARAWPGAGQASRTGEAIVQAWVRVAAATMAVGTLVLAGLWWLPHYRAEAARDAPRRRLDRLIEGRFPASERLSLARSSAEAFSRAVAIDPTNAQAWADRAYAAAIVGHEEPARQGELGRAAEADARRALGLTEAVPEFWFRLGVALDMQGRWADAGSAFSEALRLAPLSATTWFYFAHHLSLNPVTVPLARAAVATSLRLDPYRREAETLRQALAARR